MGTQNFSLEQFGPSGRISDNNYKFTDRDRETIDALLWTLYNHTHSDTSVLPTLAGPEFRPSLTLSTTGGTLPAGQIMYYKASYVDETGNETEASPAGSLSTPDPLPSPPVMTVAYATTGGALEPGIYRYALAYYQTGIGVTRATNVATINVPIGTLTNEVTITLDSLPTGATGWRIYRKGPGDSDYFWLDTTTTGPYVDDGLDLALNCTAKRPTQNTTNSTNQFVLDLNEFSLPLDSRISSWRIYRTNTVGFFGATSLLATVVETTTEGGSDLVTTYTDSGSITFAGSPLTETVVPPAVPQLDVADTFSGDTRLPAKHAPQGIHAHCTACAGTVAAKTYNQFVTAADMPVERVDVYFQTAPTGLSGTDYLTFRVSDDATGDAVQAVYNDSEERNEVQSVYNNATGGTFTLSDGVDTTSALDFNAIATEIETRLEADIASITDVHVSGVGTSIDPWIITWVDPGSTNIAYTLIAGDGSLVGGTSTVAVEQEGSDGGTFTLTFDGQTTSALDWNELGVYSEGTLTMDTQPTDGDTLTIDTKVYTFQTTLTDVDGNILIGASLATAQANLVAALNLSGTAGTDYAASMTAHLTVDIAAFATNAVVLTAKVSGEGGDLIATTETFTAGTNIFDAATLGTTTAGVDPLKVELEALSTITTVNVTGTGVEDDPWLIVFISPGAQEVVLMTTDDALLNGTSFVAGVTEGYSVTQIDVVADAAGSYFYWQSSTTDAGEMEGENALGDGSNVSDALAANDVASELTAQTDTQSWDIGTVLDQGDYQARFYVALLDGAEATIRVVDQFGGDTTIASLVVSDDSTYLPVKPLNFVDAGGTEDWRFEVEKTDAGAGVVRIDKFEYALRHPVLHAGSTVTEEWIVTGTPTTNGDDAQATVWY